MYRIQVLYCKLEFSKNHNHDIVMTSFGVLTYQTSMVSCENGLMMQQNQVYTWHVS